MKIFSFGIKIGILIIAFGFVLNCHAIQVVGPNQQTLSEVSQDQLTDSERKIWQEVFGGSEFIRLQDIENAKPGFQKDLGNPQSVFYSFIRKVTQTWQIDDPGLPLAQHAQVSSFTRSMIRGGDAISGFIKGAFLTSGQGEFCSKHLLSGDFNSLCDKGILRFILDQLAAHDLVFLNRKDTYPWLEFELGPKSLIVPLDPRISREILVSKVKRGMTYDRLVDFFGTGIFTSRNPERWHRQRTEFMKTLIHKNLKEISLRMYEGLIQEVKRTSSEAKGQPVDLVRLLSRMGLFAFCDTILGVDVRDIGSELAPPMNSLLEYINGALEPFQVPFARTRNQFLEDRDQVHTWMLKVVQRVRERVQKEGLNPTQYNSIVQEIFRLNDPNDQAELVELMISMVLGGHETTARLMLGGLYGLMKNPQYIEPIRQEVDQYLKSHGSLDYSAAFNKESLPHLYRVAQESLRLFPPVWLIGRTPVEEPLQFDSVSIPKGTQILISPLILHRRKAIWGLDADFFRPERFEHLTPEQAELFFPFIDGPMMCPGRDFARLEFMLALGGLLNYFDIQLVKKNQLPEPTSAGTFRLFQKLEVTIQPRPSRFL